VSVTTDPANPGVLTLPVLGSNRTASAPQPAPASARACLSRRSFVVRLPRRARRARVYVNGKRVKTLHGRRLRARVDLRGVRRGTVRVRIVAVTARGRRVVSTRTYHTCARRR
jgi:hypothetical protein